MLDAHFFGFYQFFFWNSDVMFFENFLIELKDEKMAKINQTLIFVKLFCVLNLYNWSNGMSPICS